MEDRNTVLSRMRICRFCFSDNESELSSVYENSFIGGDTRCIPLPLQIMACLAIEVFRNDGMPQMICKTCRDITGKAYTFKSNCKKADDAFKLFIATGQLLKPNIDAVTEMNVPHQEKAHINQMIRNIQAHKDSFEQNTNSNIIENQENDNEMLEQDQEYEGSIRAIDDEEYTLVDLDTIKKVEENVIEEAPNNCFPCRHCSRTFPLKQLLDLHVANHSRERCFECDLCNRKFFNKYDLQKHADTHNPAKNHICVVCNKSFSRYALLARHEKVHDDAPKYTCTISKCGKTFLTKEYLVSHMENHNKKRPYTCKICNKSFVFKQGLERHEATHEATKPYKCNYCEASFSSSIKLARHVTTHAGLRPYPCKLCGRTFLLSHHLTRHMKSHYASKMTSPETVIGLFKCDICSMSFRRKDSLINHSAIHSMVNLRCVICNTVFETANMVKEHITTHLTGLPFPCERCDYSFESADQLEEHEMKHAEMEYEDLIEKEVISEAKKKSNSAAENEEDEDDDEEQDAVEEEEEDEEGDDEFEDEEIKEYTITDINNSEIIPVQQLVQQPKQQQKQKHVPEVKQQQQQHKQQLQQHKQQLQQHHKQQLQQHKQQHQQHKQHQLEHHQEEIQEGNSGEHFQIGYLKNEINSEEEMDVQEAEDDSQEEVDHQEPIKPIVRQEGTKVYQGRGNDKRPKIDLEEISVRQSSLERTTSTPEAPIEIDMNPAMATTVNRKIGDKIVKVQKFILTKDEMKVMAKQGILRMRGGQVVLKSPGQAVLNATIKPVQKTDIDTFLDLKAGSKAPLKRYNNKREINIFSEDDLSAGLMDGQ